MQRRRGKLLLTAGETHARNALAAFADSTVAADAVKWWLADAEEVKLSRLESRRDGDDDEFVSRPNTKTYRFMGNRFRGQLCEVSQDEASSSELLVGVDVSVSGDRIPIIVHDWFFGPSNKKLTSIPPN
jgi:hypothetical protein